MEGYDGGASKSSYVAADNYPQTRDERRSAHGLCGFVSAARIGVGSPIAGSRMTEYLRSLWNAVDTSPLLTFLAWAIMPRNR